jgi:transcriptional regulator with XRE-family HTH domain
MSTVTRDEAIEVIADNVQRLMLHHNYGVRELARLSDSQPTQVSRLVNRASLPSPEVLYRMAKCLGVTVDSLFRRKST